MQLTKLFIVMLSMVKTEREGETPCKVVKYV